MSWQNDKRDTMIEGIIRYYNHEIERSPQNALQMIEQELHSQSVRLGNDWTGRGVVMDTVISATIEGLEIVRARCLERLHGNASKSSGTC